MNQSLVQPLIQDLGTGTSRWMVVIYNNDTNSIDEVVEILMRATSCDVHEAEIETWEAHTFGKAPVHFASKGECLDAASVIASVGIKTEVALEWND